MNKQIKLLITLLILLAATLIFTGWLDGAGREYTEQGLKRSLITYGVARGLNGIISVAQGTEVAVEPVGVGVTFTPGQVLDPINDLVERFSWVVLASGVSLGAQNILLAITAWTGFGLLVVSFLLASLILLWKQGGLSLAVRRVIYKIAIIIVILRMAVPMIAIINEGLYQLFLAPQYEMSLQQLEATTQDIEKIQDKNIEPQSDQGVIEKAKQLIDDASNVFNIDQQFNQLKQAASDISEYVLNMIVVFVLQTLVFPLFFIWLTYKLILQIMAYK